MLASAFNVSLDCLEALNETVSCDADLLRMAGTVDNYLWDKDNITALCTESCLATTATWFSKVRNDCADNYINVKGRLVGPLTIPGRMLDGMNIACLTPDTNVFLLPGVNGSEITSMVTSLTNSSVVVDTSSTDSTDSTNSKREVSGLRSNPDKLRSNHKPSPRQFISSSGLCLIDSYDWIGSDIIRPDCSDSSTEPQCLDPDDVPDENRRIANLYADDLLCSDCFLKMFYLRVASPYLPVLDYSD
ncbi:MAG: hypothetical protein CL912_17975 [Deltaproteobacteria bacterium]|nr:hypothetical protein [Deltaproteobacteria bacterium]